MEEEPLWFDPCMQSIERAIDVLQGAVELAVFRRRD